LPQVFRNVVLGKSRGEGHTEQSDNRGRFGSLPLPAR
jgi:hypothetical protein